KEAECPDKTCVNMGWLSSASMPIVCLPNHLVIEFAAGYEDGVDAVAR
ncbi:MAG: NusG domain II-containing protein, partial [Ruminococcus sp.]|nr:NusG domain II-containing protein [Ruminococcus sp.]